MADYSLIFKSVLSSLVKVSGTIFSKGNFPSHCKHLLVCVLVTVMIKFVLCFIFTHHKLYFFLIFHLVGFEAYFSSNMPYQVSLISFYSSRRKSLSVKLVFRCEFSNRKIRNRSCTKSSHCHCRKHSATWDGHLKTIKHSIAFHSGHVLQTTLVNHFGICLTASHCFFLKETECFNCVWTVFIAVAFIIGFPSAKALTFV